MAQKILNGVHISGTTQLDFMPDHESEGIITLGRYDSNTSRYHNIKSYVSSTEASNYLKFSLHAGTENAIVDVLTLKGNKAAIFGGAISTPTGSTFAGAIKITETGTAQHILIGNQDSSGTDKPGMIRSANASLEFGYGDSWTGEGGTMTTSLTIGSDSSATFTGQISQIYNPGNTGAFQFHRNANAGANAYTSKKWQNDDAGFGEIWRNSSTRSATGQGASSFNMYNSADINFWAGGGHTLNLSGTNATFAGSLTIPGYIIHAGDPDTKFGFAAANDYRVHVGGSDRFRVTGDVHVKGATDFAIPAGRKLYLDGQGNTYITESSADNIKFFTGATEALSLTGDVVNAHEIITSGNQNSNNNSSGADGRYATGILDLSSSSNLSAGNNFRIETNIPFNSGGADFTVTIQGFQYGSRKPVNLTICWHIYPANTPYNHCVISHGGWSPVIKMARNTTTNNVTLLLETPGYWPKMYVKSLHSSNYEVGAYAKGWTWANGTLASGYDIITTIPYQALSLGNGGIVNGGAINGDTITGTTLASTGNANITGNVSIIGSSSTLLTLGDTTGDTFTKIISASAGGSQFQFWNDTTQTSTINSNATNIFSVFDGSAGSGTNVFNIADGGNATFAGKVRVQGDPPITPNTNFDDLVITDSAHAGMSIFSGGTDKHGAIYFGDDDGNNIGQIKYLHNNDTMTFATSAGSASLTLDSGLNATFTGVINATDGSATTPAYNFTSHAGNGMYLEDYDASNNKEQVSWATDGTRRAWVNEPGLWTANNLYFAGQLRKFGEWHATSGTSGQGFKFTNTADSVDVLTITSAGNATFAGSVTAHTDLILTADSSQQNQIISNTYLDIGVAKSAHNAAGYTTLLYAGGPTAGTTNNIAGGHLYLAAGGGKGTGAGGDIIFRVAPAGSSGSTLNAYATALTISDDKSATFAGDVIVNGGQVFLDGTTYAIENVSGNYGIRNSSGHYGGSDDTNAYYTPQDFFHIPGIVRIGPKYATSDRDYIRFVPAGSTSTIEMPNENAYIHNSVGNIVLRTGSSTDAVIVAGANTAFAGRITSTRSSTHTAQGTFSAANAHLDLYNSLSDNTDQKGSIITFTDNYYDGSNYIKTTRAGIKGGTDVTGNNGAGYLEFYTNHSSANTPRLVLRLDKDKNATFEGSVTAGNITTSTGTITSQTAHFTDNVYMSGGQLYIGASGANSSTNNSHRLVSGSGIFSVQSRESGTWTPHLSISTSGVISGDGSGLTGITVSNADTVDNLHAASFLRSDAADSASGNLHLDGLVRSRKNIVSNSTYNVMSLNSSRTVNDYGGLNKDYMRIDLVTPGPDTDGNSSAHGFGNFSLKLTAGASGSTFNDVLNITAGGFAKIQNRLQIGQAGGTGNSGRLDLFGRYNGPVPRIFFKTDHPSNSTQWDMAQIYAGDGGNYNGQLYFQVASGNGAENSGAALATALFIDDTKDATFYARVSGNHFVTSTNINNTGDAGLGIPSGQRLGFDQSGTRSWTVKADGGNLNVFSGDGAGGLVTSLTDGLITNTINTRSGDLDIKTNSVSRDVRFYNGSGNVMMRVQGKGAIIDQTISTSYTNELSWRHLTPTYLYDVNASPTVSYYYFKVAQMPTNSGVLTMEYYAQSDVNYPRSAYGRFSVSTWNNTTININHLESTAAENIEICLYVDDSRNIWIKGDNVVWDSRLFVRAVVNNNATLFYGSDTAKTLTQPSGSVKIPAGQTRRLSISDVSDTASGTYGPSSNYVGTKKIIDKLEANYTCSLGASKANSFLVNRTSAAGVGASLGDINGAELGPGYLSLSRDDTANAKQIVFEKDDAEHSYLQTESSNLRIVAGSGKHLYIDTNGGSGGMWRFTSSGIFEWGAARGSLTWDTGYAKVMANSTNELHLGTGADSNSLRLIGSRIEDNKAALSYGLGDIPFAQQDTQIATADSTSGYHKMAQIITTRSGKVRVCFSAFIQSGSYYWSWRILKGGGSGYHKLNSLSVGASHANGNDATNAGSSYQNGLASGQTASVHAYRNYQIDIKDVVAGETIEVWMASSQATGGNITGNGQELTFKDFNLKSLAAVNNNMAYVPSSLVIEKTDIISDSNPSLRIKSQTNGDGILMTGLGSSLTTGHYKAIDFQYARNDSSYGSAIRFSVTNPALHGGQIEFWTDNSSGTLSKAMTIDKSQNLHILNLVQQTSASTSWTPHTTYWRANTPSGYINIGPQNSGYAHIETDRSQFYFNTKIIVDSGQIFSYDEDLVLARANSNASIRLGEDSNAGVAGHITMKVGELKGLVMQNGDNLHLTNYLHAVRTDAASPTHTAYYQWFTIKNPASYSNQGLASSFKVKIFTNGRHATGSTYSEYLVRCNNGNHHTSAGLSETEVFNLFRSGLTHGYGGQTQDVDWYYRNSISNNSTGPWNNGEIIFRLKRNNREPVDVIKIEPIGADTSTAYIPTLTSHGGGTGATDNQPTTNITAINLQHAGFYRTSATDGRLLIDVNGNGQNGVHEIARFVNTESNATSSYMYIGASAGTDWRLGKAVFGTGSNFHIAKHSGSTAAISINSSGNGYVGIGVNNASTPLEINGNVYSSTRFQGGNTLIGTAGGYACLGSNSSGVAIAISRDFNPGSYPDIIVNSAGNVTVGGTSAYGGTGVKSFNIQAVDYPLMAFYAGTTLRTQIISYSNKTYFGHALASATWEFNNGSVRASISGSGTITAAGDVIAYSDEKLKSNIKTLDGSKVLKMRGVSFDKDGKKGSGVIAQELEKIAPELVNSDSEYKAVAYGNITGYLIEAIKDLKAEIEELKSNKCNCNK